MKRNVTKPLSLAILVAVAVPVGARADEREPQKPNDDDVSHIDGQLVPVGKHNEYRYSYPRWNIATNPLSWMLGLYGASLSYAVSDQAALRGDVNYFSPEWDDRPGYEVNAGVSIYFRRAYQGLFLEPGVMARSFSGDGEDFGPQVLAGWHWRWDSGFNAAFALGLGKDLSPSDEPLDENVFGNGYLRFGYAF